MTTTAEAARGKWRAILPALGIPANVLDGRHHKCPCGTDSRDSFRFSDHDHAGRYFCKCSDGRGGGLDLVMCHLSCDFATACKATDGVIEREKDKSIKPPSRPKGYHLVTATRSRYLESRGLEIAPGLRWTRRATYYRDDKTRWDYAAMLAPISDAAGKFAAWHVTYLMDGKKAPEVQPRLIFGTGYGGGACRLYDATGEVLGIAEGVESAIAAKMLHGVPVWAALNAGNMSKFQPPEHVRRVIIFADYDANFCGHAAAYTLAHRLAKMGRDVEVRFPKTRPGDFNDDLQK